MIQTYTFWELEVHIDDLSIIRNGTRFCFERDHLAALAEKDKIIAGLQDSVGELSLEERDLRKKTVDQAKEIERLKAQLKEEMKDDDKRSD